MTDKDELRKNELRKKRKQYQLNTEIRKAIQEITEGSLVLVTRSNLQANGQNAATYLPLQSSNYLLRDPS